jgi:preprotein translocase subunit SecG
VQIVSYFLVGLLLITSFLMTLLILLHKGRGGGMSDMFGGGFSSSLGGSSLAEKNLDRLTVAVALIWSAAIIAVGILITAL